MRILGVIVLFLTTFATAGCSNSSTKSTSGSGGSTSAGTGGSSGGGSGGESSTSIKGTVQSGQHPMAGARVYLYAANNTGYANASVSLLGNAGGSNADSSGNYYLTTDVNGAFTISSDAYKCPEPASQVYLYASGGNPGSGANSAAGFLAALGTCDKITSSSVVVNEISTIAAAWSIAGFASDATHVSSSASALAATDIANAFATATNLEKISTGVALSTTPAGNGTVPQTEMNTLANILAVCIESTGAGSAACSTLFSNTMSGTAAPQDTATAAINIAHHPGANIVKLFGLQTPSSPFQPSLSATPNDFTIAIAYTGGGLNAPRGIAVDGSGNVWVTNFSGASVSKFSPTGAAQSGSSGFTVGGLEVPIGIAIDNASNVWVANHTGSSISKLDSSGSAVSGASGYTGGGLNGAYGIAIDSGGHIWVTNQTGNSISEFSSGGSPLTSSNGIATGGLNAPLLLAVDVSGNVWVTNNNGDTISEFDSSGSPFAGSPFAGGGLASPGEIAIDGAGDAWVANNYAAAISEFNSSGSPVSGAPFTGGGLDAPFGVAIDGQGNIWVTNTGASSIAEFTPSGTPISGGNGFTAAGLDGPYTLAIDGSSNIWVTNYGNGSGKSITEFVGAAAAPVVTPIVANLLPPYGSHAVNKP
jgi:streptogramin lyase